jgi:hypothetical protein
MCLRQILFEIGKTFYWYFSDVEAQSSQWVGKSSLVWKKTRQSLSNVKVLLIGFFFNGKDVVHHEFVPHGQSVDSFTWRS